MLRRETNSPVNSYIITTLKKNRQIDNLKCAKIRTSQSAHLRVLLVNSVGQSAAAGNANLTFLEGCHHRVTSHNSHDDDVRIYNDDHV